VSEPPWLVVGLGNPGDRYARNRHNVGAMAVDRLAADLGERFTSHRARAQVLATRLGPAGRLVLAKPATFMNESGGPVAGLVRYFDVPPGRLLVVHDELDLPFEQVRLKLGGGEGGHNGLRSVSASLSTRDYGRCRVGIGRPPGRMDPADFVLRDFSPAERRQLDLLLGEVVDAVARVVEQGFEAAQNLVNGG
jgi:peptidyl-tRNA hydrolase, PTH1 family